ncbi:endonuclease VII domain-containing protein [Streptosporangium sp. G12]
MHYNRWRLTGEPGPAERLNRKSDPAAPDKVCTKCGETKLKTEFSRNPKMGDGRFTACKSCVSKIARNARFKRKYGITADEYDQMLESQNGVCLICSGPPPNGRPLVVDHCHSTGDVRGLLCNNCNALLGMAADDIQRLTAAITYLEKSRRL